MDSRGNIMATKRTRDSVNVEESILTFFNAGDDCGFVRDTGLFPEPFRERSPGEG
jgi:hypothetical protein